MGIIMFIIVFVIGAIFAAAGGDTSGIEAIVAVVGFLIVFIGGLYILSLFFEACGDNELAKILIALGMVVGGIKLKILIEKTKDEIKK